MTHKNKLRKTIWSLALCASMILSCLPISAFAEGQDDEHIHEHTTECGLNYSEEETTEVTAPAYTAEDVKAMIDALPSVSELESMSKDELNSVYEQAQEAYDAFETLTDEEQMALADDLVKLRDVLDYTTGSIAPLATTGTGDYGVTLSFAGSITCRTCGKDVSATSIKVHSVSLIDNDLIISATITWYCGHTSDYNSEGSRLVISNFSCTQEYSNAYMKQENGSSPGIKFYRKAGHTGDSWFFSNNQHSGYCNLCKKTLTEDCSGGSATCQNKAICSTCGNEYGNTLAHNYIKNATSIGNGQHTATCEWCSDEGTADCTYVNGTCKYCGGYQSAIQNEGYYEISNAGQLLWFAQQANNGSTGISGKLTADINLENRAWTPIGTENKAYTGTFDGNGKTISNFSLTATSSYQGLFGIVSGGTVKNFTIRGTISISETVASVGGAVGRAENGAIIDGITSYVTINDTRTTVDTTKNENRISHVGGIVGSLDSSTVKNCNYNSKVELKLAACVAGIVGIATNNCTITYCTNNGTVTSDNNSAHVGGIAGDAQTGTYVSYCINYGNVTSGGSDCIGGIVAYANDNAKIEYCANIGEVKCTAENGGYIGGILGYINSGKFSGIIRCYNYGSIKTNSGGDNHAGAIIGWNRKSNTNNVSSNNYYLGDSYTQAADTNTLNATAMTKDQFSSGEVAYLLNGSTNAGTWKQTVNSDKYPSLSGKDVYGGYICGSGSSNPVYRNSPDGLISISSPEHIWKDGICTNCGATQAAVWDETEKVYKIYNLVQLQWFADKVNTEKTTINGKLMADIDASTLTSLAIGINGKAYSGTFDGNGYTLTIGLNSTAQYAAPFQYVNGATIKNLVVKGSITTNQKFAASIVGQSTGTTTIENCLSYVTINSSVNGDGTHGGLVANVQSGTTTINNCGFAGAINGSGTDSCGGLVGWSNGTTKISNSFVAATFSVNANNGNTFSRGNNITVTNCYYLNALGDVPSDATQKSADQFASGEVAWVLNGSKNDGAWKQTLGENRDAYPNFGGGAVYKTAPCESYSNAGTTKEHDVEYGVCKNCNAVFQAIVPATWSESKQAYVIYTASQLVWFAGLVNGTLDGVEQNQFANAILMNDIDMSSVTDYIPIGGTTGLYNTTEGEDKGYQGTFDGNGHVIKNLSVTGSDIDERAYGVFGTLSGTVKHLGVENFTFTLGSQDCRAGGIAGQMLSGSLIEDCYVVNSTITATGKVAGGIAGCNYAGTIQNCFTYKVTITATRSGGIVGDNCGDNNSDRKGSVINCYTDASNIENSSRKGNISGSTADMSASDFASGQVGYMLDGNRDLWKQTIGSHYYPTFNGDTIKVDGYNIITGARISAKITWTAMEFTYVSSGETWNPDTHSYGGGTGSWSPVDSGGKITVENTGADELRVKFEFVSSIEGVSGNFDVPTSAVASGGSIESKLSITGSPNQTSFNNQKIGSVNITLSKNILSSTWNVGDAVTWYGDDGNAYSCYVVSKTDDKYVLMTDGIFKNGSTNYWYHVSLDNILSAVNATGGRVPNWDNAVEKEFVSSRACNYYSSRLTWCTILMMTNGKYGMIAFYEDSVNSKATNFNTSYYNFVWLAFDVPIS